MSKELRGGDRLPFYKRLPTFVRFGYAGAFTLLTIGMVVQWLSWLVRDEIGPSLGVWVGFAAFVGFVSAMSAGLVLRKNWGRWLAIVFGAVAAAATIAAAATSDVMTLIFVMTVPTAVGGLLFGLPAMKREFDGEQSERDRHRARLFVRNILLLVGGVGGIYFVAEEARNVSSDYRLERNEELCRETGALEACGQSALMRIRRADDAEDLVQGEAGLQALCRERGGSACRVWGLTRGVTYAGVMRDGEAAWVAARNDTARRGCLEGDMQACWVHAHILDGPPPDDVLVKMADGCDFGDEFGCWARWTAVTRSGEAPDMTVATAACQNGLRAACEQTGEAPEPDPRRKCWRGDHRACGELAEHASGVDAVVYRAMADVPGEGANTAFIGASPPVPDGLREACDNDSAPACFGAGLWLVRDETTSWRPDYPQRPELDTTFGRACDLGMDVACRAYALRLIDRSLAIDRDVAYANELLTKACERGDGVSCWLRVHDSDMVAADYDGLRKTALEACLRAPAEHSEPCETHANLVAAEIGVPWPRDDRIAYSLLRHACRTSQDPSSCAAIAVTHLRHGDDSTSEWVQVPPLRTTAYDTAAIACEQGSDFACGLVWEVAAHFPWASPDTPEELRTRVCAKHPDVTGCE